MSVKMRQRVEREIAEAVIDSALKFHYVISVNDGEETTLERSTDKAAILAAMFTTGEDYLHLDRQAHNAEPALSGWVRFIYGNDGWDVINDYITNLEAIMGPVNAVIEKYED